MRKESRSQSGISLVELLIVSLILTFVSSAAFGMMMIIMNDNIKNLNKCDSLDATRNALEKITRSVRMGRSLGDVYGEFNGQILTGSATFPSATTSGGKSNNPVYGGGQAPPNGWPTWVDGSQPSTFTLSNTCLIVQRPAFDASGFPLSIPANTGNPANPNTTDNVETDVYRVLPDPNNNGEWVMQLSRFPGMAVNGYAGTQSGPTTLCSGIVGPLGNNGQPRVFQFLDRTDNTHSPQDTVNGASVATYSGVIINLELHSHKNSKNANSRDSSLAFKTEVFLRNNAMATTVGVPEPAQ